MKVYLAARYSRRMELAGYATELRDLGINVTSRWLLGLHDTPPEGVAPDSVEHWRWCAEDDIADVDAADVLVAFSEPEGVVAGRGRGGRHVELGYAIAIGKPVIVVGYRENVFCCLPQITFARAWSIAKAMIVSAETGLTVTGVLGA